MLTKQHPIILALLLGVSLFSATTCFAQKLPSSVTGRPLFTSFNPSGDWSIEKSAITNTPDQILIHIEPWKPLYPADSSQTFAVQRIYLNDTIPGCGIVDGNTFYVTYPCDGKKNRVYPILATRTEKGYEGLFGYGARLGFETGKHKDIKALGTDMSNFNGHYDITGINSFGGAYTMKHTGIVRYLTRDDAFEGCYYISYISDNIEMEGGGFVFDNKLIVGRYPILITSSVSSQIGIGVTQTNSTSQNFSYQSIITAYRFENGKLTGKILVMDRKVVFNPPKIYGDEVLIQRK